MQFSAGSTSAWTTVSWPSLPSTGKLGRSALALMGQPRLQWTAALGLRRTGVGESDGSLLVAGAQVLQEGAFRRAVHNLKRYAVIDLLDMTTLARMDLQFHSVKSQVNAMPMEPG